MALSRREMMVAGASSGALLLIRGGVAVAANTCTVPRIPAQQIDGPPEFIPGAPLRTSLEDGETNRQRIRVFGRAVTTDCRPLLHARIEFWHTDAAGTYAMTSFKHRGAQLTDGAGRFHIETVMPGPYNGPRHIHYLLVTSRAGRSQPLMLSAGIFFPTAEEFAKARPDQLTAPEFLDPATLQTVDGVLLAPCDIVLEV